MIHFLPQVQKKMKPFVYLVILLALVNGTSCLINFPFASGIITQNALLNGPSLYANWIMRLIQYLQNYPLPNRSSDDNVFFRGMNETSFGCSTYWIILGSEAQKTISLVSPPLIQISSSSTITVTAQVNVAIRTFAYLRVCEHILFICSW